MQNTRELAGSRRTNTFLPRNCKLDGLESIRWNATLKASRALGLAHFRSNINLGFLVGRYRLLRYRNDKSWPNVARFAEKLTNGDVSDRVAPRERKVSRIFSFIIIIIAVERPRRSHRETSTTKVFVRCIVKKFP